jgi:hypothetical protein
MKQDVKDFRKNFRKFQFQAKPVPCDIKLPLLWNLVMECIEKNKENEEFVRERWRAFTIWRIKESEKRLAELES